MRKKNLGFYFMTLFYFPNISVYTSCLFGNKEHEPCVTLHLYLHTDNMATFLLEFRVPRHQQEQPHCQTDGRLTPTRKQIYHPLKDAFILKVKISFYINNPKNFNLPLDFKLQKKILYDFLKKKISIMEILHYYHIYMFDI